VVESRLPALVLRHLSRGGVASLRRAATAKKAVASAFEAEAAGTGTDAAIETAPFNCSIVEDVAGGDEVSRFPQVDESPPLWESADAATTDSTTALSILAQDSLRVDSLAVAVDMSPPPPAADRARNALEEADDVINMTQQAGILLEPTDGPSAQVSDEITDVPLKRVNEFDHKYSLPPPPPLPPLFHQHPLRHN
jgi:hypothetical protein